MSPDAAPLVDVAFDCLPLRSVGRVDVPLDASDALRRRMESVKAAMEEFGPQQTYYLYNGRCVFRFANSEIDGVCRFHFEGVVRTDAGDRKCQHVQLDVRLASETCGGVPPAVEAWLAERVERAVAIEFDRFIAAGQLAARSDELGAVGSLAELGGFSGMNL
jgi:hypothetical protein